MANIATITINDGQSTPVPHAYNPIQVNPALYRRNGVAGQAIIGQERLLIDVENARSLNGVNKINLELVLPVMEQATGGAATGYTAPPAIAHEERVKVTFFFHNRSDAAGRKDLRVLLSNLLLNAQVVDAVDNVTKPI